MVPRSDRDGQPEVVVVGAACIDVKGRAYQDSIIGTATSGMVSISVGGCARNVAENLARLGLCTALLSAVCEDDFGHLIIRHTERAGVDASHMMVACQQRSSAYIALLGEQGQLLMGIADTSATAILTPQVIDDRADLLRRARLVVIDTNVSSETGRRLLSICRPAGVPVVLAPVSYTPTHAYRHSIGSFYLVTPNAFEAQALTGMEVEDVDQAIVAAKLLIAAGVEVAIITLAQAGVVYATSYISGHVPAIEVEVIDATGAGDALTAAVVYALLNDIPVDEAVRLGVSAATLTLGSTETVRQDLSLESLYAQMVI